MQLSAIEVVFEMIIHSFGCIVGLSPRRVDVLDQLSTKFKHSLQLLTQIKFLQTLELILKHFMGQIININVGKAGVRIGEKFWQNIGKQHFIGTQDVRGRSEVFFNQSNNKQFQSRSIFLDIDPRTIDKINLKPQRYTICNKNMFRGSGLQSDLFSTGKYLEGAQIVIQSFEQVRRQAQKCDRLSGFLLINSIAGGTGSGMAAQMLNQLRQSYCAKIVEQHFVLPQTQYLTSPLHVYNTVLTTSYSVQLADLCIMAENLAFTKRLMKQQNLRPTLDNINQLHAQHMTQITAPYRFSGSLNTNQRKTCTNMIPFPRVKFITSSCSKKAQKSGYLQDALNPINFSKTDSFGNQAGLKSIYTIQVNCRDNLAYQSQVDSKVKIFMSGAKLNFTQWLPNNIHLSITEQAGVNPSASALINSRHVYKIFKEWTEAFTILFRRRSFIHNYTASGMDEMEFTEAESNLNDLISELMPHQVYDGEEFEGEGFQE